MAEEQYLAATTSNQDVLDTTTQQLHRDGACNREHCCAACINCAACRNSTHTTKHCWALTKLNARRTSGHRTATSPCCQQPDTADDSNHTDGLAVLGRIAGHQIAGNVQRQFICYKGLSNLQGMLALPPISCAVLLSAPVSSQYQTQTPQAAASG
jgi:hypothetical protein